MTRGVAQNDRIANSQQSKGDSPLCRNSKQDVYNITVTKEDLRAGRNRADETARALIEFFKGNYGMDYLHNVPEEVVSLMKDTALEMKVNENNCDDE